MATQDDNNGDGRGQTGAATDWSALRASIIREMNAAGGLICERMIVECALLAKTAKECAALIDSASSANWRLFEIAYDGIDGQKPGLEA